MVVWQRKRNLLLVSSGLLLIGLLLYVLAVKGYGIPCIFRLVTKYRCPGCGNTQAVLSLLRGDFNDAFAANYLFPLEFGYLLFAYVRVSITYYKTGKVRYVPLYPAVDITILVLLILWGIIRNILGT